MGQGQFKGPDQKSILSAWYPLIINPKLGASAVEYVLDL